MSSSWSANLMSCIRRPIEATLAGPQLRISSHHLSKLPLSEEVNESKTLQTGIELSLSPHERRPTTPSPASEYLRTQTEAFLRRDLHSIVECLPSDIWQVQVTSPGRMSQNRWHRPGALFPESERRFGRDGWKS